jgi:fatty-acyl-CoA synthase
MSAATATVARPDGRRGYASARHASLVAMLADTAGRVGAKTAFVDERGEIAWAAFHAEVEALAGRLAARGIGAGDRVALLFGNGIPYTVAVWAVWRLGAIAVPLNGRLLGSEMAPLVQDAGAALLLGGGPLAETAREVAAATGTPVELEDADGALLAGAPTAALPDAGAVDRETPAAIMYTSGTTGRPKGVVVTHGNLIENSRTCIDVIGRRESDVELVCVPQFNITGLGSQTVPVVDAGMTGVLVPRFEVPLVLETIARHRTTSTVLAPTMWWRLLEDEAFAATDVSSLRLALFGGAPMPTALLQRMRDAFAGATFGNGYGMTETCSMVTYIGGDELLDHLDSVGRALPITEVRVVDPVTGRDCAVGEPGELWFRGPQVSRGYWRNEEATAALFAEDGWLRTGDAGSLDADGFVTLRDRLKDVIKRGGESIYCFEVENVLHQHPAVLEAAVVGVPDEVYGETVAAIVAFKPGAAATADELRAFCGAHLARFKVPRRVAVVDALPRNAGGKVLKAQLRELAAAS